MNNIEEMHKALHELREEIIKISTSELDSPSAILKIKDKMDSFYQENISAFRG